MHPSPRRILVSDKVHKDRPVQDDFVRDSSFPYSDNLDGCHLLVQFRGGSCVWIAFGSLASFCLWIVLRLSFFFFSYLPSELGEAILFKPHQDKVGVTRSGRSSSPMCFSYSYRKRVRQGHRLSTEELCRCLTVYPLNG